MKGSVNSEVNVSKMIIHRTKPLAFGTKPAPELLHTIYISPKVCNKPQWPAWCRNLRISYREMPVRWSAGWTILMSMLVNRKFLPLLGIKLVI